MKEKKKSLQTVKNKFYKEATKTFLIFAITAVVGASIGGAIDYYLGTWPLATFILLGVFYFVSWGIIIKFGLGIKNKEEK